MATCWTSAVALLVLLFTAVCSGIPRKKVYYIKPSLNNPCPVGPCLTLSQFANRSSHYLASETTLSFMPGNHSLWSKLSIANISALTMISTNSNVLFTCNRYGMFDFYIVATVYIKDIHFFGCSGHKLLVSVFVLESVMFNGAQGGAADVFTVLTNYDTKGNASYSAYNHYNITIVNSQIFNSAHGVLLAYNIDATMSIVITRSHIINNSGIIVYVYGDTYLALITVKISNSSLIHNSGNFIHLYWLLPPLIIISHCQIANNSGLILAGISRSRLVVNHTHIISHQGAIIGATVVSGVSITHSKIIDSSVAIITQDTNNVNGGVNVCIHDSQFIHNRGGIWDLRIGNEIEVVIFQSLFINNTSSLGGVMKFSDSIIVIINRSSFINNTAYNHGGVMHILSGADVIINQTTFIGNRARNGGVVSLLGGSLTVTNSSFMHNSADHEGGAIYIESGVVQNWYIVNNKSIIVHDGYFWNNTAGLNGGVMAVQYGNVTINGGTYGSNFAVDGGVFQVYRGYLKIINITCLGNTASVNGGVIHIYQSTAIISQCCFYENSAMNDGGAINAYQGNLTIYEDTSFRHNVASNYGGAIFAYKLYTTITGNSYHYNEASNRGGTWFTYQGTFTASESIISLSTSVEGGVLYADQGVVEIHNVSCMQNKATYGGALHIDEGNLTVHHSSFSKNIVKEDGGAWLVIDSHLAFQQVSFINNTAKTGGAVHSINNSLTISGTTQCKQNVAGMEGGAMYLYRNTIEGSNLHLIVERNRASKGAVFLLNSAVYFHKESLLTFSYNSGSFLVSLSNATLMGTTSFISGSEPQKSQSIHNAILDDLEGGALTVYKGKVIFGGNSSLMYNYAQNGGAILASESEIYVERAIKIAYNRANRTGGGIYLYMSVIHCQDNSFFELLSNSATNEGGGAYVTNSIIRVDSRIVEKNASYSTGYSATYRGSFLHFFKNEAEKGGALYLETNSKIYILNSLCHSSPFYVINFTANSADYGGSVYVSDDTYLGLCNPDYSSHFRAKECIFQVFATYTITSNDFCQNTKSIFFSSNYASFSGSDLFGGLIDRCKIHHFTEFHKIIHFNTFLLRSTRQNFTSVSGLSYMLKISNIKVSSISSEPAQLCICKHNIPDCNFQPGSLRVTKIKSVSVELIAVDQVNHSVSATIRSSLSKTKGGLGKGQDVQYVNDTCTELKFNFSSPYDSEELIMHAEGPCESSPLSQRRLKLHFTLCDFCPIGFEKHVTEDTICECVCNSQLRPFITTCNITSQKLQRKGSFWVSYVYGSDNDTSGYLIYPHCPYNYCHPPTSTVEINLNIPDGADAQCAYGHTGTLCGTCPGNLSISLGTSRCIPCSTNWHLLIILATFIAGIALVTLLCTFNLRVTVGTLNGILFYANIVAVNESTFLPFAKSNFATIFISWLNLDIGFDVCFFEGMDAYWKTLLQLAFPTYVIILLVLVIIVSECSIKFRQLVYKTNPMATLATIVLFSFTKFLNNAILFLSFASLKFPDGSRKTVWLPDASVEYLSGKHIIIFILAIFILVACIVLTFLLFSWQFILYYQQKPIFIWTRYHRLRHFIEPYLAAYNNGQSYWIGLLLFIRVILCTITAINVGGFSKVNLVLTNVFILCLLFLKGALNKHNIYKIGLVDVIEMITYFNIACFAILTLMMNKNQDIIAYISVSVTITLSWTVMIFHAFHYTCLSIIVKWAKLSTIGKVICCIKDYEDEDNELP